MKPKTPKIIDGITHWQCPRCFCWNPESDFYKSKKTRNGLTSQCKACHTEGSIRTRNEDTKRSANRKYMRLARQRSPEMFREKEKVYSVNRPKDERWKARVVLNQAVRRGNIKKPDACSRCGCGHLVIEAHHDDYSKPLDVKWLCSECHGEVHRVRT